jgi:RNA polymerase sigma-70 factor (ECF subfamily)
MASLQQVISAYGPALSRLAASYERDPGLREELMQEVLLAIHQALPRLREADRLKAFVFRIAHNRALSHVVARMREPQGHGEVEALASDAPTPEHAVAGRQAGEQLTAAVRRLPLPYRQVVVLVLEDFSYDEIAETLGISVSNVGVRMNRAKAQLRSLLNHD